MAIVKLDDPERGSRMRELGRFLAERVGTLHVSLFGGCEICLRLGVKGVIYSLHEDSSGMSKWTTTGRSWSLGMIVTSSYRCESREALAREAVARLSAATDLMRSEA